MGDAAITFDVDKVRREDDEEHGHLAFYETFWRDVHPFLTKNGYALRPRYHPDWIPSWRADGRWAFSCEDGTVSVTLGRVMDVLRLSDGRRVAMKRVKKTPPGLAEIAVMHYFSSEPCRSDPRNRCVPLLDVLDPGDDFDDMLIVIPLLQHVDKPDAFLNVGEAMEFCHQVLEGLSFMHDHNVEHRDCCRGNIMMDGELLYPDGHHPARTGFTPDLRRKAKHIRRSDVHICYYFIDFGHSIHFPSYESREPLLRPFGQDKTAPELQVRQPTNGFQLDVYCVGNMFREELLSHFPQLQRLLGSLVDEMTRPLPSERLTSSEAHKRLEDVRRGLRSHQLTARLRRSSETFSSSFFAEAAYRAGNLKRLFWRDQTGQSAKYRENARVPYRISSPGSTPTNTTTVQPSDSDSDTQDLAREEHASGDTSETRSLSTEPLRHASIKDDKDAGPLARIQEILFASLGESPDSPAL